MQISAFQFRIHVCVLRSLGDLRSLQQVVAASFRLRGSPACCRRTAARWFMSLPAPGLTWSPHPLLHVWTSLRRKIFCIAPEYALNLPAVWITSRRRQQHNVTRTHDVSCFCIWFIPNLFVSTSCSTHHGWVPYKWNNSGICFLNTKFKV